jgi:hypothetical protein
MFDSAELCDPLVVNSELKRDLQLIQQKLLQSNFRDTFLTKFSAIYRCQPGCSLGQLCCHKTVPLRGTPPLTDEINRPTDEETTYFLFCANEERSFISHSKYVITGEQDLETIIISDRYTSELYNYEHMIEFVSRKVAQQCHD